MGRKLGFTSLFFGDRDTTRSSSSSPSPSSWPWPSCNHPRTHSFRAGKGVDEIYKTVNSVYFDSTESWFTKSSVESESFSTASEADDHALEAVIRGTRSDRLFFEPGDTSSILEEAKPECAVPFKESVVMAMESKDPYHDFRVSMEEMVAAQGTVKWECLEELLVWYLRVNGRKTHGFIVGAFVDLIVGLASPPTSSSSSSSIFFEIEELKEEEGSGSC